MNYTDDDIDTAALEKDYNIHISKCVEIYINHLISIIPGSESGNSYILHETCKHIMIKLREINSEMRNDEFEAYLLAKISGDAFNNFLNTHGREISNKHQDTLFSNLTSGDYDINQLDEMPAIVEIMKDVKNVMGK